MLQDVLVDFPEVVEGEPGGFAGPAGVGGAVAGVLFDVVAALAVGFSTAAAAAT